jgi:hypothetical protein
VGHVSQGLIASMLCGSLVMATSVPAADGNLTKVLKAEQSVRANLLPISPTYVTPKCLVPYPVCKLVYASVALIASWEQLLLGGDLKGAQDSLARGFDGPWAVQPEDVTGQGLWSLPEPIPLAAYFSTGRTNGGPVRLDPMPPVQREEPEGGDVLPP